MLMFIIYAMNICYINAQESINMQHIGNHGDHSEFFLPADAAEVYFDNDAFEIIIVADGFASYYYVEIFQTGYTVPVISTQIDGYGDTVDVSSLSDGDYTIVITSEYYNVYQGYFAIEWEWPRKQRIAKYSINDLKIRELWKSLHFFYSWL